MTATSTMAIASNVIHEEESLDPRIFAVIDEISDDEAYQRIVSSISFWLDQQDVLLIASMLNTYFPPADPYDVAECLDESVFTVILNPLTNKLEWESDSTRYIAAGEWTDGDNAFGYRPPDRILLAALEFDGTHIQFIDSPTEEMKLAAVQRTSAAIKYIKNPSDAVRCAAAITATAERPHVRAAFARKYGPSVAPADGLVNDGTLCRANCDCGFSAAQDEPEYWVQGVGPLNLFSDLLICTVMELNSHIGNDERAADFVHVKEVEGALVLSFSSIRQLFSLRDVFREMAEMKGIENDPEMDFDGMSVIEYPSIAGRGFITWGRTAAVSR
jgi:hypothetical protein